MFKKQNSVKLINRKNFRLQIVGINLMKIREALVSVRVSLGTLPSKEKLKNDNESNNNKNITNNSNKKQ